MIFPNTLPRNRTQRTVSRSKAVFVFCFFILWLLISIAILVRYDFYGRPATDAASKADLSLRHDVHQLIPSQFKQNSFGFNQTKSNNGAQDLIRVDMNNVNKEKQTQKSFDLNEVPVLSSKTYTKRPDNIEWQKNEAKVKYLNSNKYQMHGELEISNHFKWLDSLRHPLSRNVTDIRPIACRKMDYDLTILPPATVIVIFCNEVMELLLRSVHSILDRTPPIILREILLVDDYSDDKSILPVEFGGDGDLQRYIKDLPKVRYVRLEKRGGIVGARIRGIEEARGDVFIILDSHIETVEGWLEPLLQKIDENPRTVVMPVIDGISRKDWVPESGGIGCFLGILWKMMEHGFSLDKRNPDRYLKKSHEFISSPVMAGGLFGANREFFLDLGGYDLGMSYWGTENLELSFRIWQCGGSLECTECSHVHHLFGGGKRYSNSYNSGIVNKLRTMAVWMDQYADLAWQVLGTPDVDIGDISDRIKLRNDLKCRNFQWFLDNVWPESEVRNLPDDVPFLGAVKNTKTNTCLLGDSLGSCSNSNIMYFRQPQHIRQTTNDESCLTLEGHLVKWDTCSNLGGQLWNISKIGPIQSNRVPNVCLTVKNRQVISENGGSGASDSDELAKILRNARLRGSTSFQLTAEECRDGDDRQIWQWTEYSPPLKWIPPTGKSKSLS